MHRLQRSIDGSNASLPSYFLLSVNFCLYHGSRCDLTAGRDQNFLQYDRLLSFGYFAHDCLSDGIKICICHAFSFVTQVFEPLQYFIKLGICRFQSDLVQYFLHGVLSSVLANYNSAFVPDHFGRHHSWFKRLCHPEHAMCVNARFMRKSVISDNGRVWRYVNSRQTLHQP